jgi:general secretion pathway protein H
MSCHSVQMVKLGAKARMQTSDRGINSHNSRALSASIQGFTLLELLVVVAIMALATAGVGFALRDNAADTLERDAQRLAVLLESARAQSRMSGTPVYWQVTSEGFTFKGLANSPTAQRWLHPDTRTSQSTPVNLGPEPILGPQSIDISSISQPHRRLRLITDGVQPFRVSTPEIPATPGS